MERGRQAGHRDSPSRSFTDVPPITNFAHIPIDWAILNQVTLGVTPTTFCPADDCTRAQVVTFLWRAEGEPKPTSTDNPFTDVTGGYYYDAVLWAVENKITTGTTAITFSPDEICNRAQIVTFLYRAFAGEE